MDLLTSLLTFDPDLRQSAAEAMNHPYFEMFKNVGHDRLVVPPPEMTKADFSWESEKSLTKQQLREILYQEIAKYHPESGHHARFAPTASNEVREQISALERGDKPARATSTSMPAEQTAPLFAQAQKMASQGTLEETDMIDVGEECVDGDLVSPVRRVPVPNGLDEPHGSDSMAMDDDEYAYARPQTISADDVAKLASSAVESITPGIDEEAMERAAMSMANAATRGASWQQLSQRQDAAVPMGGDGRGAHTGRERGRSSGRVAASRDLLDVMRDKKMKRREQPSSLPHQRGGSSAAEDDLDMSPRDGDADGGAGYSDEDESNGEEGDDLEDEDGDDMMSHVDGEGDVSSGDDDSSGNEETFHDRARGGGRGGGTGGVEGEGPAGEQCTVQ